MYFLTETGSVYEIDEVGRRIRRLSGVKDPTPRQGKDGEWKSYFSTAMVGKNFLIVWNDGGEGTMTSPIVKTSAKFDELVTVN